MHHAIDIADLDTDHHNPFNNEHTHKARWLITTCIAGVAGGLVIGGALLGTFGLNSTLAELTQAAASCSTPKHHQGRPYLQHIRCIEHGQPHRCVRHQCRAAL